MAIKINSNPRQNPAAIITTINTAITGITDKIIPISLENENKKIKLYTIRLDIYKQHIINKCNNNIYEYFKHCQ